MEGLRDAEGLIGFFSIFIDFFSSNCGITLGLRRFFTSYEILRCLDSNSLAKIDFRFKDMSGQIGVCYPVALTKVGQIGATLTHTITKPPASLTTLAHSVIFSNG